ncbi:MAG: deoxyribonuclease IV [Deltaproteobacteria bacterium]|nr:deoxyribonuclease IV [Deltaproteobacteria bacterium]
MQKPRLGAHMSVAGGVTRALEDGVKVGCQTVQIFTKNSNQWSAALLKKEEVDRFLTMKKALGIDPVLAHNSYLINLASPDPKLRERSKEAMRVELDRAKELGVAFVVMHPGAHVGSGEERAIGQVSNILTELLEMTEGYQVSILLENTAGQGSCIGYSFEHLQKLMDGVTGSKVRSRLGVCLDTCHLFAAGYDISNSSGYEETMKRVEETLGIDAVRAFHVNDSKKGLGSRVDRHEHIGKGVIGVEAFRLLLNDARFAHCPMLLETPKGEGLKSDIENLNLLKSLCDEGCK